MFSMVVFLLIVMVVIIWNNKKCVEYSIITPITIGNAM